MSQLPTSNLISIDTAKHSVNAKSLESLLQKTVQGEVRFDDGSRALYVTDGLNYRQVPIGVLILKTMDDVVATVKAWRQFNAFSLSRGSGTSLTGQFCNVVVVIDWSKHLNQVLEVDAPHKMGGVHLGCVEMISQNTDPHALHLSEVMQTAMHEGPQGSFWRLPRAQIYHQSRPGESSPGWPRNWRRFAHHKHFCLEIDAPRLIPPMITLSRGNFDENSIDKTCISLPAVPC